MSAGHERIALSVTISGLGQLFGGDLRQVVETARIADDLGIDQLALPDHLAIGERTDRYPYGRFPFPPDEPWPEPLTLLSAIASATRRIRLATGILIAPLRPPLLLAKTLATLDALSGGRVDLGIGTGWQREEFVDPGLPFRGRATRMDDTLRACRALWTGGPASFESETVTFDGLWCVPRPAQVGGIPIWLGGALSEGNFARLVEYCDGWMPIASPDELESGARRLRAAFAESGRDPAALRVRAGVPGESGADGRPDLDRTLATLPALRARGATHASLALARFARAPEDIRPFLEKLASASDRA